MILTFTLVSSGRIVAVMLTLKTLEQSKITTEQKKNRIF